MEAKLSRFPEFFTLFINFWVAFQKKTMVVRGWNFEKEEGQKNAFSGLSGAS